MRGPRPGWLACVAMLGMPVSAAAQEAIMLDWSAPPPCPSKARVLAQTYRMLAGRPEGFRQLRGEATVSRNDDGWSIALTTQVDGTRGRRELNRASSCSEIAEFAALELALAYDPMAVLEAQEEAQRTIAEEQGAAERASAERQRQARRRAAYERARDAKERDVRQRALRKPPEPPALPVAPDPEEDRPGLLGGMVAAIVTGDIGAQPDVGFGFGGMAALRVAWFRLDLEGTWWLPQSSYLGSRTGPGGRFEFVSGALLAGPWWRFGEVFGAGPRAGLELGWMRARGLNVDRPTDASLVWVAARVGGQASVTLVEPLAFRLELGVAIPFDRPRWVLDGLGELGRPSVVTGRAGAGLSLQF